MAETLTAATKPDATPNTIDKKATEDFFRRLDNLHDDFESASGEFRADVKALYNEAADTLGVKKGMFRHAFQTYRSAKKRAEKEAGLEQGERDELDLIRSALGDYATTPLGKAALS